MFSGVHAVSNCCSITCKVDKLRRVLLRDAGALHHRPDDDEPEETWKRVKVRLMCLCGICVSTSQKYVRYTCYVSMIHPFNFAESPR